MYGMFESRTYIIYLFKSPIKSTFYVYMVHNKYYNLYISPESSTTVNNIKLQIKFSTQDFMFVCFYKL